MVKFLVLLAIFSSVLGGAALLRPRILSKTSGPEPEKLASSAEPLSLVLPTITQPTESGPSPTPPVNTATTGPPTATPAPRLKTTTVASTTTIPTAESSPTEKCSTPTTEPPSLSSEPPSHTGETQTPITVANTPVPAPTSETYTVQPKDNLFRIGLEYNLTVDTLLAMNHLTDPNVIFAGQELVVQIPLPDNQTNNTYQVRWGDTLWRISQAFGTTVEAIATINGITDTNVLFAGTVLTIP
ncbi:MAG: LysM peptidoglycan-binding domain-containing protein [Anaerolineales bacterium]|nr:LysM peptidoglycan-binding domain-containing protein [Anaerolineales bacterium]